MPTETLKRRGSREVVKRSREPKPERGTPRMPPGMSPAAKKVWKQVVPPLVALRVATKIDGRALQRYCEMLVDWEKATKFIEKMGFTYATGYKLNANGVNVPTSFQQFPEVGIRNKLSVLLLRLEQEFGLTPAARARIEVDLKEGDAQDPLLKLLKERLN